MPNTPKQARISNVTVPLSVIRHPARFGGREEGAFLRGDLVIESGRATHLLPTPVESPPPRLVLPKFTECHVHLDKCHTVDRIPDVGGDLMAAISAQARDRSHWTDDDLRRRATRGLNELCDSGCGAVRSHVDWTHGKDATSPPRAWHVLHEIAQEFAPRVTLQIAPLLGIGDLVDPSIADRVAQIAQQSGVLGAFVYDQPMQKAGIAAAFHYAQKYQLALDFHVDEGLSKTLNGLEMIADAAITARFEGPVLCGHACSLMNRSGDALARISDKIVQAGLTVVALPTTNLYLQGRNPGSPDHRGITRLRELAQAGVPVAIGTDNVRDAFCPIGRHDPRASLAMAVLGAHLDPPLDAHLPMITLNAQIAMGLDPITVDGASLNDLLIFECSSVSEMLAGTTPPDLLNAVLKRENLT